MLRLTRTLIAFSLWVSLSACEKEKRATDDGTTDLLTLGFFNTVQVAISTSDELSQAFRAGMSFFSGMVMIAQQGSNLDALLTPPLNQCRYAFDEGIAVKRLRNANVGDLIIRSTTGSGEATIPKGDAPNFNFGAGIALGFGGTFQIETTGIRGSRAYQQNFQVTPMASNLKLRGAGWNTQGIPTAREFVLPTPEYHPTLVDADIATLDKTKDIFVDYTAPAGTAYVKVTVNDGAGWDVEGNPYGNVVCYGAATGPVWIPAGALNYFKSSPDAMMYIDFVSTSRKTDAPKVNDSVILSVTRHMHGRKDFVNGDQTQVVRFGALQFE